MKNRKASAPPTIRLALTTAEARALLHLTTAEARALLYACELLRDLLHDAHIEQSETALGIAHGKLVAALEPDQLGP